MKQLCKKFLSKFFLCRNWKKKTLSWYAFRYPGSNPFLFLPLVLVILSAMLLLIGCEKAKDVKIENTEFTPAPVLPAKDETSQEPTVFAPPIKEDSPNSKKNPQTILQETMAVYSKCKIYWDNAHIEAVYEKKAGGGVKNYVDRWPCSIVFQKPAQIQMKINDGRLYSDGKKMYGFIHQNNTYSRICLERNAPNLIGAIKDLYPDARLASAMQLKIPSHFFWVPPQLVLLLARNPLNTFLPANSEMKLLAPAFANPKHQDLRSPDAELCDRIEVQAENVKRTLWISRLNNTLVRIEFPIENISVEENVERMVRLTLEIPERKISDNPRDSFIHPSEFSPEAGENISSEEFNSYTKADKLLSAPLFFLKHSFPSVCLHPLATGFPIINPSETKGKCRIFFFWKYEKLLRLLNDEMQDISFESNKDQENTFEDTEKRLYQEFLTEFELLKKDLEENPMVECYSVCVADPGRYSDTEIRRLYGEINSPLPLYSLSQIEARNTFLKRLSYPSVLVVGSDGIIQKYYRAISPIINHVQVLSQIRKILAGNNIYDEDYVRYETDLGRFSINMESSDTNDLYRTTQDPSIQEGASDWLPRHMPETFKLTESWRFENLPDAGNPLSLAKRKTSSNSPEESDNDLLVIPCEGSNLAVLSAEGKLLKKVKPNIRGAEEPVTFVRTALLSNGKRYFVASSLLESKKLQRYDGNFQYQGVIDLSRTREQWVTDVRLTDINSDGDSDLLVSLLGDSRRTQVPVQGIYAVDEKTKQVLWKDESLKLPYRIGIYTLKSGERWLLALNQPDTTKGNIIVHDLKTGKRIKEIADDRNMSVVWFGSGQDTNDETELMAAFLEQVDPYQFYLAGFSPEEGKILWRTPLTQFNRNRQIERVAFGDVTGDGKGEWLVPLADGTILFFDSKGKCFDRLQYGKELTGLCIAQWESGRFLIITDTKGVTAWKIN